MSRHAWRCGTGIPTKASAESKGSYLNQNQMTPHLESQIREWVGHSEGWMVPERAIEMAQLILDAKPRVAVEIGVFGGRSLVAQGIALKELGVGQIYGIDPWKTEAALEGENEANKNWWSRNIDIGQIHQWCMNGVWKYGLDEQVVVLRARSQFCVSLFAGGIDHLFIDGNHSEIASTRDVNLYLPLLQKHGILVFDDANWPSTQKALEHVGVLCDLVKDGGEYRIYRKR
jgi:predicted O-methyltransferase YrrM